MLPHVVAAGFVIRGRCPHREYVTRNEPGQVGDGGPRHLGQKDWNSDAHFMVPTSDRYVGAKGRGLQAGPLSPANAIRGYRVLRSGSL